MTVDQNGTPGAAAGGRAKPGILLFLAVCVIAANMRTSITGIGPLLQQIGDDTGIAVATLGALASVPLIAWALMSPLAHDLSTRFGLNRVMLGSLVVLALGTLVRSLPGPTVSLWLGTLVIGAGLAIANVLMPAVIKREFPTRIPAITSLYTALLGGVGAIGAGLVVPISHIEIGGDPAGWRIALLCSGILLPVAVVLWLLGMRKTGVDRGGRRTGPRRRTGVWTDAVAWQVGVYMGTQAATFYILLTWIAPISISVGRSEVVAGFDTMTYQILGVVGSLSLPLLLRGRFERWVPPMLPLLAIIGTVGLMIAPDAVLLWAIVAGYSGGSSLAMSLTLMASRARDHTTAGALSGMSQSVGYVIGAIGPVVFGWLHTITGGWQASLVLLASVSIAQGVVGLAVGRDRHVLDR